LKDSLFKPLLKKHQTSLYSFYDEIGTDSGGAGKKGSGSDSLFRVPAFHGS
jgi:hypothetical protein